jgi:enoyl-CoA hydratase
MDYETIIVDRYGTDNRIGLITLNRPDKLNSLSKQLLNELEHGLKSMATDDRIRVIVIRGSGRGFGAGYDQTPAPDGRDNSDDAPIRGFLTGARKDLQEGAKRQMYIFNMPKVVIAQVHGYCLAGSCEYAMMADLVVAAEDARIGHPGVRGLGHPRNSCLWPMVIGMRKAKELMYTGDTLSGTEAAEIGMINKAVPEEKLEEEVTFLADRIANQTADSLAVHKEALNRWYQAMGMESSIMAAADYDLMYYFSGSAKAFNEKVQEVGMKEAFTWRDTPYKDGRSKSK